MGQTLGPQHTSDHLALKSNVALVVDQDTNEVLLAKNPDAVLPIASLTKLMTTLVVVEARQNMDEVITITDEDIDTERLPLPPGRRHQPDTRRGLAPGAHVVREPGGQCPGTPFPLAACRQWSRP